MIDLNDANIPACFMAAGYRLAPRYTIRGEPKRLRSWQTRATTDLTELQKLIAEATQSVAHFQSTGVAGPNDGVCDFIVVPPKAHCIIDIDNKNGKDGSGSWKKLCDTMGTDAVQPRLEVKTKSGGFHYYFKADCDYVKSVANFAGYTGVDVRGQRGHVVLPFRVGSLDSWKPGEYVLVLGNPQDPQPTFKITKLSRSYAESEEQLWLQDIKESIGRMEAIESVPAGARDTVLWDAACILYRKGIKRDDAEKYMLTVAAVCETTDEMSLEQIKALAIQKIDRVYKHDRKIVTVIDFEREMALGGLIRIANDGPSKYFFEHDNLFKLDVKAVYSKEALSDTFKGIRIVVDDGEQQKVRTGDEIFKRYVPEQTVYGMGFYPDPGITIFRDDNTGQTLYNTYEPTFSPEKATQLAKGAEDLYPTFLEFLKSLHPTKWPEILDRIAWNVQFPQLKMVSLAVYVSPTHGVGKDILCDLHGHLLGLKHYKRLNSIEELTSRFIDFSDTLLVNVAEVQMGRGLSARNKIIEFRGLLKTLTTSSTLKSEKKNVQANWRSSFTNFVLTANEFSPNMLEYGDRRHEVFIFPATSKLNQSQFGKLADLSKSSNYSSGQYPLDKLASIWVGLRKHEIKKRYHIDSATEDEDKQLIVDQGISPLQAWLLTELPDIFSKDFVIWFIANFYPQRDKLKPMEEAEYFFTECKTHIRYVYNNKGVNPQKLSMTKLHRVGMGDGRSLDLQRRAVPRGPNYYQYMCTVRNHGEYDDRPVDEYYTLEEQIIKFYKDRLGPLTNKTDEDLHKILTRFRLRAVP